jgi:isopenicillin N synthase-like dioxygenase
MCRYSNNNKTSNKKEVISEIFGAHSDTSFVTIVPAAKVSGLEVFDEDSLQWYRPELNARKHAKTLDPTGTMDGQYPWHSRYLIVMPGELLQLTSRNNIPAAVHRVVAAVDSPRLSAPVLLRARPGTEMNVERYMGSLDKAEDLLLGCNGMKMEDIHDALQQSSKS